MLRLLLLAAAAAATPCLIGTTLVNNAPFPPDAPAPLCLYRTSASILGSNVTYDSADMACIESALRPTTCAEVVPLAAFPGQDFSFDSCAPLRTCQGGVLITPSFRLGALQNSLQWVVYGNYWTQSTPQGSYAPCGYGNAASATTLLGTGAFADCAALALPVLCLCVDPSSTPAPTPSPTSAAPTLPSAAPTSAAPSRRPSRAPSQAPSRRPSRPPSRAPSRRPSLAPIPSPSHSCVPPRAR